MDAAASVINIIQLTGTFLEYLRAAKQAHSDRRKLLLEANSLLALLTSLRDFLDLEDRNAFLDWRQAIRHLEAPDGPFAQYQSELENLLAKVCPASKLREVTQNIIWKLTKEDVNDMLLRLERLKSLVSIALEMDSTHLSQAILVTVNHVSETAQLIRTDTFKLVNAVDEASFRSLLDQICIETYSSVYQSNITEHTEGIGQNFISSPQFRSWMQTNDASQALLCVGDPGVGKTVNATKAIQTLRQRQTALREAVLFVYCDCTRRRSRLNRRDSSPEARSKGVQTPSHIIASLLRQLVETYGSPTSDLQDLFTRHEQQKTRPSTAELVQVFGDVARGFDRIYIVVDAMDECDSLEVETFASHLFSICSAPACRLLVTTRRHPQIEQMFEDCTRLDMCATDADTLAYLQSRAKREFPSRVLREPQALARILQSILHSANGIPLIARLHMNVLRGIRTPGAMLAAIARLGSGSDVYDETYQAAMERITKQPGDLPAMALRVLRWICCAKRYLMAGEVQCILAMDNDSDCLDEDFMPDMDDVLLACEGLVCIVPGRDEESPRLELVHTTARQYFDRCLAEWAPDASLDLARTSLNMLSFMDLSPLPRSLIDYAWRYWGLHAKDVEDLNEGDQLRTLSALVQRFLDKEKKGNPLSHEITVHKQHKLETDQLDQGLTGYHLTAKFGLTRLFEALRDPNDDLDAMLAGPSGYGITPLQLAILYHNVEMAEFMIKLANVDSQGAV